MQSGLSGQNERVPPNKHWSAHLRDKLPSPHSSARGAQLKR
jgi:hypothetical protein